MIQIIRNVRSPETTHGEVVKYSIGDLTFGISGDYDTIVLIGDGIDAIIGTPYVFTSQLVTYCVVTHSYRLRRVVIHISCSEDIT